MTSYLKRQGCSIHVSTVAPRKDVDVDQLNDAVRNQLRQLSGEKLDCIDIHKSFVFGDGLAVDQYYHRDGVHLNRKGTSVLVRRMNDFVPIIKTQQTETVAVNQQNQRTQPATISHVRSPGIKLNMPRRAIYRNDDANRLEQQGNRHTQQYPGYANNKRPSGNSLYYTNGRQSTYPVHTGSNMPNGRGRHMHNNNNNNNNNPSHQYFGSNAYEGETMRSYAVRPEFERNSSDNPPRNTNYDGWSYPHRNVHTEIRTFRKNGNINNNSSERNVHYY